VLKIENRGAAKTSQMKGIGDFYDASSAARRVIA
jgi:hypothetical protein